MKILQIRFKNLNSLVGEWLIDLNHPDFVSDGIFAITGPTGAGKSTILDAVCLALYGRTPRLDRVNKSGNEIISRQTGECFAEVTFQTRTGRYRCHWSQHRARRKPQGELQTPKHEIAHADSGEILDSGIRGVAAQIEAATGMDFYQFTRSILLAQGDFAAFLQAEPDGRAPILEQITGTEIYSRISMDIHERQRAEKGRLDLLEAEMTGIAILEPEREEEIARTLEARQAEEVGLNAKCSETGSAIAWLVTIAELKKEIASLEDEALGLQEDVANFNPQRELLRRAEKAATQDGAHATLTAIRRQQIQDKEALQAVAAALPDMEALLKELAEARQSAELRVVQAKDELTAAVPTLRQVRSLDQKLADQKKTALEYRQDCATETARIRQNNNLLSIERENLSSTQESLRRVNLYLEEHGKDEWLVGNLTGIEEQLAVLNSGQNEIAQKEVAQDSALKARNSAIASLEKSRQGTQKRRQELSEAGAALLQGKAALEQLLEGRLLREYRAEKDHLQQERLLLAKIAELKEHRAQLREGGACPLCGATEHPYAQGNIPVPDEVERKIAALDILIGKAEQCDVAIQRLGDRETLAHRRLAEAEKLEAVAVNEKSGAERVLTEAQASLLALRTNYTVKKQEVCARLQSLGVESIPDDGIEPLLKSLKKRLEKWRLQTAQKTDIERRIAAIENEIERLKAVNESQNITLAEKRERLENLSRELSDGAEARQALYGDKRPDDEEQRLTEAIAAAEKSGKLAIERYDEQRQTCNAAKTRIEELKSRGAQREPELLGQERNFTAALAAIGFVDEAQFLSARLPSEDLAELRAAAKGLDERSTDLKARRQDREARLSEKQALRTTDGTLEELEPRLKEQEEALKALREIITGFKLQLSANLEAKERQRERLVAVEAQRRECRKWDNLHQLIGSADGKKYRNFAQGLTFEIMIEHANQKLARMSDRYLLYRDKTQPLELNVIDNYQAGEIRSTKNLSGGESFIVSLALALGLSQMASKNVRVDSLFLDEGFGTLDEEALDTALETLASLRQDDKLIGVISHVVALKDRIGVQIQVAPRANSGKSVLAGPGCREID